jgi:hypothetical protein
MQYVDLNCTTSSICPESTSLPIAKAKPSIFSALVCGGNESAYGSDRINERGPGMIESLLDSQPQIRRVLYSDAPDPNRLSNFCKVRVLQVGRSPFLVIWKHTKLVDRRQTRDQQAPDLRGHFGARLGTRYLFQESSAERCAVQILVTPPLPKSTASILATASSCMCGRT